MKKTDLLFIILSISLFCASCNKPHDLTKAEVYKIMNDIIADNNIRLNVVCASMYRLSVSGEWSSEFTAKDQTFIQNQQELFKNFKFEPHQLKSFWPRTGKPKDVIIDRSCKAGMLNKFSFPLISADRQKVLLEIEEDCNCMLGGQESKFLFAKINGHWKRTKSYDYIISDNNDNQFKKELTRLPKI